MANAEQNEDCVSKKPWREVLTRSLKLFMFNAAKEGGKSFGRIIFYIILGIIVLLVATYLIESMTGWLSSWFDFWPFNRADAEADTVEKSRWFNWGGEKAADTAVVTQDPEDAVKWYCKWNPIC